MSNVYHYMLTFSVCTHTVVLNKFNIHEKIAHALNFFKLSISVNFFLPVSAGCTYVTRTYILIYLRIALFS